MVRHARNAGRWSAERILIGLAGGRRLPRRTSLGPSPLSALARDSLAAGAGRMVLVQPNDPPSPAGGNPTLPCRLWSDLPQDGPGDGGGGPLLPVTLRSSGQRSRAGARTKKMPRGVRPHPDG